jgi:hypothetical protein
MFFITYRIISRSFASLRIEEVTIYPVVYPVVKAETPAPRTPIALEAAAGTTTTDPTSTDPSFKAGKDL